PIIGNTVYVSTYDSLYNPANPITESTDLTYHALRANTDNNHVIWASIEYDRLPDAAGDSMMILKDWAYTDKQYLRLSNVTGGDSVFVYDLRNRVRQVGLVEEIGGVPTARVITLGFPNTRDLIVATDAAVRTPGIEAATLNNLYQTNNDADFIIITHRGFTSSAETYKEYRDTATTHPLTARIVYTDEIYDEFGYGTITPWAIKRFCKYALDNYSTKPKYFLLWGKGPFLTRGQESASIVPTYGYPATDYEFIGHFDQNSNMVNPEAAIGRVNIFSNDEGLAYLNKVNEYEHTPWNSWMKEGVFLGGGANQAEQNAISGAFNFMIGAFTDIPFGGKPHYFQKNSASTIIDPTTASYHDQITEGVQVIHFFGHSTSNILDISIRQPFEYNNFGRYPLMVAMGCYGGDFTAGESFGESWIKQPRRGAIGYIANSSAGYLNPLRAYGQIFYTRLYQSFLGQPVGDALRNSLVTYTDSLVGIQFRNHGRQLNLQGDPAVKLYSAQRPDLEIDETSVYFTPDNFT
ncbi:MAG: C25 family cysteine peptidase, partial [Bacteroidota bacterium]